MSEKAKRILLTSVMLVVGIYFFIMGLVNAKSYLAPLSIAILLTMVLIPLSRKFEKWGINRGFASFYCTLIGLISYIGLFVLLSLQVNSIVEDWPQIKKNVKPAVENFQSFIKKNTGLSPAEQVKLLKKKIPLPDQSVDEEQSQNEGSSPTREPEKTKTRETTGSSGMFSTVGGAVLSFLAFLGTSLLVFIYIFFLLLYRSKLKSGILKFFPERNRQEAAKVLNESISIAQSYLVGRLLLILFLAAIYSTGLSIFGVKSAILISVIAALLSLIPYVGVAVGYLLAISMTAFSGGSLGMFIGVTVTYGIAQFVESYVLEPYLVGNKVDLNPLITILIVVIGGAVWGIMGMIIIIPFFGIIKIICDHVPVLNPIGYVLGQEDMGSDKPNVFERMGSKIKGWF